MQYLSKYAIIINSYLYNSIIKEMIEGINIT